MHIQLLAEADVYSTNIKIRTMSVVFGEHENCVFLAFSPVSETQICF